MKLTITSIARRATAFERQPLRIKIPLASTDNNCGCSQHRAPAATIVSTERYMTAAVGDPPVPTPSSDVTWHGTITLENVMTGDARLIEKNALRWATLPIPLRYAAADIGGHDGAVVVGGITKLTRNGNKIDAEGYFDMESDDGREAARQVDKQQTNGVSVDLDEVSFEIRVAKELMDEMDSLFMEPEDGEAQPVETDSEGRVTVLEINADDEVMVTTDARVRAATIVAIPAFEEARIALDEPLAIGDPAPADAAKGKMPNGDPCSCTEGDPDYDPDCDCSQAEEPDDAPPSSSAADTIALAASGFPLTPPQEWFSNPQLSGPTPLTVTDDGRVFGHLAAWGTCHAAYQGQCVTPPASDSNYAYFRVGSIITAEGSEIPVGHITLDTFHAGRTLSAADTIAHYEHTGRTVADVAAGDDEHGIWIAGALRPTVTDEQLRVLRSSPLSGDWRRVGSSLELVAALAVNVPGFPIPRPQGMVASGVTTSLVASGMLAPRRVLRPGSPGSLSADDLRYLKRLADRERREEQAARAGISDRAAQLARRVRAGGLADRVRSQVRE